MFNEILKMAYRPIECVTARVNHSVNHGLWVVMMGNTGSVVTTTLVGDVGNGGEGLCFCGGHGIYRKSLISHQSCCEP